MWPVHRGLCLELKWNPSAPSDLAERLARRSSDWIKRVRFILAQYAIWAWNPSKRTYPFFSENMYVYSPFRVGQVLKY